MGERLTKEREAEIRGEDYGPRDCGCPPDYVHDGLAPAAVDDLLAELDALRAEIDAMRAAPPTTYLHADGTEEPIGELVARAEKAEADLAETCAKLARLRDAAERFESDLSSFCDGPARDALRAALSTTGPTLAEIRRAAQVEVLRDAVDTACAAVLAAVPCCNGTAAVHAVRRSLEKRADDLEAGRE